MAGDVNLIHRLVNHVAAPLHQLVDHVAHSLFVAGDGPGGYDNKVVGSHLHLPVVGGRHPGQGRHGLSLAAGGDQHNLILGVTVD